ncbi:uncharacterized protein LOC143291584 [Babylonia areolata]|uniref:uncharacterized protein LOC143291584 n=1 Tax=Babylonia areolata TaxID=304850 RepID=UPI003FD10CB6
MKQLTGGRQRPKYRLSPNEVEQLKKEETERRRKLRIVQVREQSKHAAAAIRHNVKQEKKRQLAKLAHEIENELEREKEEEVRRLEQQYDNTLRSIGQAHTQAVLTDKKTCNADKRITAYKNEERAQERHREALRRLALDKAYQEYEETKPLRDRQAALMEEKKRSAEVAARPPPPPDPVSEALLQKSKMKRPVPLTDLNAFSSTHYHVPDFAVEKAAPELQPDGKAAGEEEDQRTKEEISERRKKEHDQIIRARIRGNEALKKEKLKHDYDALMADLSLQQRADRRQRQLVVSKLPKQVFIPADRHMEELEDKQMEMERAFEDMYMKQMNLSGDLSLTLDPNPMPGTPVDNSMEADGESPLVIPTMPAFNPALRELTNVSCTQGQATQSGKPDTVLKKLLNKIKEQRSEVDTGRQVDSGQENLASDREKKGPEPDFREARQPTTKPSADPQLDLSPLKAPGNQKPQKSRDMDPTEDLEESTTVTDGGEASFLQNLQHRLQAIELQRDHLDRMMRQRQQHVPQSADVRPQSSGLPSGSAQFPTASAGPQGLPQASGNLYSEQSAMALSGGPARDVGVTASSGMKKLDMSAVPHSASAMNHPTQPAYGGLGSHHVPPATVERVGGRVGEGGSAFISSRPLGHLSHMSLGSGYPQSSSNTAGQSGPVLFPSSLTSSQMAPPVAGSGDGVGSRVLSSAPLQGVSAGLVSSGLTGGGQVQTSSVFPMSAPPPSVAGLTSVSAGGGALNVGGANTLLGGTGFQAAPSLSLPPSSLLHSRGVAAFPASHLSTGVVSAGLTQPGTTATVDSSRLLGGPGSLASQLAVGGVGGEERLQKLREYQQQLIVKHQERMRALQDVRTSIETRQAQADAQPTSTVLSASQRLADPAAMVPYTLKTSLLQPQSSAVSQSSHPSRLPTGAVSLTSVPLSSGFGAPLSSHGLRTAEADRLPGSLETGGAGRSSGAAPVHTWATAPVSSRENTGVLAAVEPILAGSAGVAMPQDARPASSAVGTQPSALSHLGDRPSSSTSSGAAGKLDSVRKSLPFDDVDEGGQGEGGGDTDGVSMADDSHLSSSTERGSPALGSRSNKSSTSGKSGSGLSATSDGSLGGSSLVARAEEKRLSFEQRQRELQDQLAEIQRQKDALLQRYHGNQQRVSAQEESLRSKLKTAKAAASGSGPPSLSERPAPTAVSLGVHQSASPSTELEERSLCSERTSTGRSWAAELEEYSLSQHKSPASMTLEEVSITSDPSAVKDISRAAERPGSTISSLEEYSLVSGRLSLEGEEGLTQPGLSARGSQESLSARRPGPHPVSVDLPDPGRGRLNLADLTAEVGEGGTPGQDSAERQVSSTWSDILSTQQLLREGENAESSRLPPPPIRQSVTDYEPHELSTILEVDTPQTGTKTTAVTLPPAVIAGPEGTEKTTSRRYIDFSSRHGTATEEDRESKLSASGSSASSDVRSVIEVRTGILKSGETSTTGSGDDTSFSLRGDEKRFRENILESSSMKGVAAPQGGRPQDPQPSPSQEVSYASSGQGFQSLELTLDSLTPRSVSVEDSQARRYLDFSSKESAVGDGGDRGGGHADEVLKQARQFNTDLMAAIQRQSADVFDQSSLSSLSQAGDNLSRASQQSAQGLPHQQ